MNLLLIAENMTDTQFCDTFKLAWTIIGYVIFAIKVIVPIILIITGMITLGKAVMAQKDDEIKKAQGLLIKKVAYAVAVFLVIQIVSIVIGLVSSSSSYKTCAQCAFHPFDPNCTGIIRTPDTDSSNANNTNSTNN